MSAAVRPGGMGRRRSLLGAGLLLLSMGLPAAPPPSALEVQGLDWTPGPGSAQPSVLALPSGEFLLGWQRREGEDTRLEFARFPAGAAAPVQRGEAARGRDWFVNWADFPAFAVLDNGDWVGFVLRASAASPYAYDIHLVRSTDGGRRWSAPTRVNDDGQAVQHGFVSLLPDGEDRVLLVWLDGRQELHAVPAPGHGHGAGHGVAPAHGHEEGPMSLRAAVLGRDGVPRQQARLDADTCSCCQTDLVRRGREVLAVYRDHTEGIRDIAVVRRGADGRWRAPEAVVADGWRMPGCPVNGPAAAANGAVAAVAWPTMARGPLEVKLALSPREGAGFGPASVLEAGEGVLGRVDLAAFGGGFLASWIGREGEATVLRVAELDHRGRVRARQDVVRLPPGRQIGHPRLAASGGQALLAWTEPGPEGTRVRAAWLRRGTVPAGGAAQKRE